MWFMSFRSRILCNKIHVRLFVPKSVLSLVRIADFPHKRTHMTHDTIYNTKHSQGTNPQVHTHVKSPCPSPSFPLPPQSNILRSKNQPRGQGACFKRYLAGYRGITSTAFLLWEKKRGADAPDMATSVPSPHADLVCPKALLWRGMARFS